MHIAWKVRLRPGKEPEFHYHVVDCLTDCDEPASCAGHPPGKIGWSCLLMVQPAPPHNQCRARAAPKFSSHNARPVRNRNAIITTERGLLACNHSAGARCGNQRRTTRDDMHGPNGLLGSPGRAPPKMTRITLNTAIIRRRWRRARRTVPCSIRSEAGRAFEPCSVARTDPMKQQREDYTTTDPRGDEGQEQPNDIRRLMLLSKVREYGRFDAAVRLVGLEVAAQTSVCITRTCSIVQAAGRTHTCSRTGPLLPARRGTGRCERGQHGSPATEKVHADDADADAQHAAAGSKNLRQRRATLPSIEADRRANLRFPPIPSQVDRQYQLMLPSSENRFFGNRNGDCAPKTTSCALRAT